ncbi:hypothetical protein I6A60_06430 [Frankia sp. AgB1.9]|uniref:hypothetical protein n=1 Tax=unclassified Frankia TaxID=2632575 RepID=UPI00193315B5|nr:MULTISPECIES: hypothetical protein [unclassified Frankia]MBL7547514.1 hypothetical protein [Frankia sp. AgB1.9]
MPTQFFSPNPGASAVPARFMTVGAVATAVVAGWSSTAFAATTSPAGQGTAARATACDTSDAIVIGSRALAPGSYSTATGSPGTLYTKYSRRCNTGWAYLQMGGALPAGTSANAFYDSPVYHRTCSIGPGGTGCSTLPTAPNCGAGISVAGASKTGTGINEFWEAENLTGVMC